MCGISGIISYSQAIDIDNIRKMTDIIKYRGPDDYGYLAYNTQNNIINHFKERNPKIENPNLLFGHRRLSIIDLSKNGHQPMSYLNEKYWIVLNGEIYNYIEIRKELEAKGYLFSSQSDTEVVIASYIEWGTKCLDKFIGMWSFALLNKVNKSLFCARDRLGIKPFYYHYSDGVFSFGSEIKQLLELPWVEQRMNPGPVFDFFVMGAYGCISEETWFEGIFDLRGGHYLLLDLKTKPDNIIPIKYWGIDKKNKLLGKTDEEYAQKYYELFEDAVRLRLRSDVPVGSALSGGLDSSGIVCLIDKIMKQNRVSGMQKTFTATSDINKFDETNYANEVIRKTNVNPYYTLPTAERLFNDYEKLIWHQEEPFISTSIFAGWCVSRLVKENGVVVSLDGQGPDEMLGGYFPFYDVLTENLFNGDFRKFRGNYSGFNGIIGLSKKMVLRKIIGKILDGKLPRNLTPILNNNKQILNPEFFENGIERSFLFNLSKKRKLSNEFDNYSFKATTVSPLPGILKQVDRNSMAFSVESRVPFVDHRLVEYSFSLPSDQKVRNGVTKYIYRNAMKGVLPEIIRNRKSKLGFVTAEPFWLSGELKDLFIDTFENNNDLSMFIDMKFIKSEFYKFQNDKKHFNTLFWRTFNFIKWYNIYNVSF